MKILTLIIALGTLLPITAQEKAPARVSIPRLRISPEDVLRTHTVRCGDRDVTFCKIRPLSLPPIPEPEPREPLTEAQIEEFRRLIPEKYRIQRHLFIGATAYVVKDENGDERYYSKVRYWVEQGADPIELWVNANFVWLSGHMAEVRVGDQPYVLMLASSVTDVDLLENLSSRNSSAGDWSFRRPDFPDFDDSAGTTIQIAEGDPTAEELAPIRALLAYYDSDTVQLKASYEKRLEEAEQRRRERLADPPERKGLIIRHWRMDSNAEKAANIR